MVLYVCYRDDIWGFVFSFFCLSRTSSRRAWHCHLIAWSFLGFHGVVFSFGYCSFEGRISIAPRRFGQWRCRELIIWRSIEHWNFAFIILVISLYLVEYGRLLKQVRQIGLFSPIHYGMLPFLPTGNLQGLGLPRITSYLSFRVVYGSSTAVNACCIWVNYSYGRQPLSAINSPMASIHGLIYSTYNGWSHAW